MEEYIVCHSSSSSKPGDFEPTASLGLAYYLPRVTAAPFPQAKHPPKSMVPDESEGCQKALARLQS